MCEGPKVTWSIGSSKNPKEVQLGCLSGTSYGYSTQWGTRKQMLKLPVLGSTEGGSERKYQRSEA